MEWNRKSSSLWDWENLFEFNAKAAENPKKVLVTDYSIEGDQFFGSGSFDSPEYGGFSIEESGSDIGHASSKSSKSASIYSSSIEENRTTNITIESSEEFLQQFCGKKELVKLETPRSSSIPEVSAGSGEPLLGLELGKRMYFEDIGSGQNAKSSHRSVVAKICKPTNQTASVPRCQVEGCNLDLSLAKDYHRKHRICESHTKSPRIIVASKELRFCQQCSRFHALSEFDDNKRSCRKRLLNHNARRRKPQPEALSLNPTSLSSLYDERQHMNFIFDHAPTLFTRHTANLTWNGTKSSYLGHTRTREYISKPSKAGVAPEQLYPPNDKMSGTGTVSYHSSGRISPSKGTSSEALKPGLEEPVISSNLSTTPNLNRALSLLSTSSGVSCETKPTGQTEVSQPAMTQALPLASDYWQPQQLPVGAHLYLSQNYDDSHFQDLNFFKTPYESRLNSGQFN